MERGTATTPDALSALVAARRSAAPVGITSVCSAHPLVLEATMREARTHTGPVLVEATSNQVDQFGGYTGMRPPQFRALTERIAARVGVDRERLILGGDHLGPNPWSAEPADVAMAHAEELVAAYARAGFTKIHLDCSMALGDDGEHPGDAVVSRRAARLLAVAEANAPDRGAVSYVIGTEVPVPGGAREAIAALTPTAPDDVRATIEAHREAFAALDLADVWPRVRALVVQPGVEFDEWNVVDYDRAGTHALRRVLDDVPGIVFEAHSTDYQTTAALSALVRDGWAVLKVGPWLTFALREALFALEAIESELIAVSGRSRLGVTLDAQMVADPRGWAGHHHGDAAAQRLARRFSLSDRARYYWTSEPVAAAQRRLLANLSERRQPLPLPLVHQWLPAQHARVRAGTLAADASELVIDHVCDVLRAYRRACEGTGPDSEQTPEH